MIRLSAVLLVVLCALVCIPGMQARAAQSSTGGAVADHPSVAATKAVKIGVRPHAEMHWPSVLEAYGYKFHAGRLRAHLLDLWALESAGESLPEPATIGEVMAASAHRQAGEPSEVARPRWAAAFERNLHTRLPAADVPVPDEIDNLGDQLSPAGPGVWLHTDRLGNVRGLYVWLEAVNRSQRPFPAIAFGVTAAPVPETASLAFDCTLPRTRPLFALGPGQSIGYLCRARGLGPLESDPSRAAAWVAQARSQGVWRIAPVVPVTDDRRERIVAALAVPLQPQRDAWLAKHPTSAQEEATRAAKAREQSGQSSDRRSRRSLWERIPTPVYVLGGLATYVAAARAIGPWWASLIFWVVGNLICAPLAFAIIRHNWADSWGGIVAIPAFLILISAPTGLALVLPLIYEAGRRFFSEPEWPRRVFWIVLDFAVMGALMIVVALLRKHF